MAIKHNKTLVAVNSSEQSRLTLHGSLATEYNKILVAVDGSEQSRFAAHEAIAIAKRNKAELTIVTSIDLSAISHEPLMIRGISNALTIEAKGMLKDFTKIEAKTPIDKRVLIGVAKHEIINHAKEEEIDLIVMGATGKGAVEKVFIGSTTDYVLTHAPCSVLAVRSL